MKPMEIYLLRHGATAFTREGRFQGKQNVPLSPEGLAELCRADFTPGRVYVSPLRRALETAAVLFPDAERIPVPGLREMDFGGFEGRAPGELEADPAYRAWQDSAWMLPTPDGDDRAGFSERACGAFAALVDDALAEGRDPLVILAHGGVQMAVMERFALPRRPFHQWCGPLGGGYVLAADPEIWSAARTLRLLRTVRYTRGAQPS